jgi:hypothetical protein
MNKISQIKTVNPLKYTSWDDQIQQFNDYSIFHSSFWAKLLSNSYGYKLIYFIIEENGILNSLFPMMVINSHFTGKRAVSLPYSDFCKPLLSSNENLEPYWNEILKVGKSENLKSIEFKIDGNLLLEYQTSIFQYRHKLKLDKSEEEIFSSFRKGTKSSIKKAIKEGVEAQIDCSFDSIKKFCQMNYVTRRRHGLPPQPDTFFNNLFKYLINNGHGFIVLAKKENQIIAGAIYLTFGKKVLYKYSASYPEYMNLNANNVVMWEAIKYALSNNFEEIDFGISEASNEGLRVYKNGWGVEESKVHLYKFDLKENKFVDVDTKVTGLHNKIFSKAPISLLRIFSSIFYKHFG